jgi:2-polyprenyl-3-methyl-5-hydroxy-6-metoxy-1,4-benzoquinol methylase
LPPERRTICNLCDDPSTLDSVSEVVEVSSNVRKFADRRFTVWRCKNCQSVHSRDVVDLTEYYREYPFQRQRPGFAWRLISRNYLRRLKAAGFTRQHSLLDYGCGSGLLVEWLRREGYRKVDGFDAYGDKYSDRNVLGRKYDFVILQDVLEHTEEPTELLDEVVSLTARGGIICAGTPNAEALDLSAWQGYVHSLHQPYHLHMLSASVLRSLAARRGLTVERFYDVFYADTFLPCVNVRFCHYYANLFDNTLDLAFDALRFTWHVVTPKAVILALFGRFWPPRSEMMFLFRKPG